MGGGGLALGEAADSALHPVPVHSFVLAYVVLAVTASLDAATTVVGLRPLRRQAAEHGFSPRAYLSRSTDPALVTVVVGGGCAVVGAIIAGVGLAISQATTSSIPDTAASAIIGLLLLFASAYLLRTNRALLTGRGVGPALLRDIRHVVAKQPGVLEVTDLFAVVVGPLSLVVDGDVRFDESRSVAALEHAISQASDELRERW